LNNPFGVAVTPGEPLHCNENNQRAAKSERVITIVAGNGIPGFSGDNGPATNAQLNFRSAWP
jgi:hypothetical protein